MATTRKPRAVAASEPPEEPLVEPAPPPPPPPSPQVVAPAAGEGRGSAVPRGWSRRQAVIGGAVLVLLVALVIAGVGLIRGGGDGARASALAAAKNFALVATRYDYQHVDADYQAVVDLSTGQYRRQFLASSTAQKKKIADFQAKAEGRVDDAAVRDLDGDQAVVLVFVDQVVTNTSLQQPTLERARLRLTLTRSGGSWLVSKLESM